MANIINPNMDSINASMAQVEQDLKALVPGMGVIAKRSGDTQYTADSEAYSYRKTPSSAGGAVNIESIVGGSVGANQLSPNNGATGTAADVTFTNNGDGSWTINGTATARSNKVIANNNLDILANHVFLLRGFKKVGSNQAYFGLGGTPVDRGQGGMLRLDTAAVGGIRIDFFAGDTFSNLKVYPQIYDLTQMLGTTIADYIYSLEQANAGAGVAYFEKYFGSGYHAYNAGSIVSVNTSGRRATGKNLASEVEVGSFNTDGLNTSSGQRIRTIGFIPVIAGEKYTISLLSNVTGKTAQVSASFYADDDYNLPRADYSDWAASPTTITIPSSVKYARLLIRFTDNSTVSLSSFKDIQLEYGTTATAYEPYKGITYPTTASDLRGIFKLTDGKLTADGDVYLPSGAVTRKYGIVNLGSLTWTYQSGNQYFQATVSEKASGIFNILCPIYTIDNVSVSQMEDMTMKGNEANAIIYVKNLSYTDGASFKTAMSGVYLVYELATPTTETLAPYSAVQNAFADGTEEWLDTRSVALPVPNSAQYASNEQDKLNSLMGAAGADGTYLVAQESGQMRLEEYEKIVSYTTAFDVTQASGSTTYFYADRVGRTLFLEAVFRPASAVSANTVIAHINNISGLSRTHWSAVTDGGSPVRLVIDYNGRVTTESAIAANAWVSTSCAVLVKTI